MGGELASIGNFEVIKSTIQNWNEDFNLIWTGANNISGTWSKWTDHYWAPLEPDFGYHCAELITNTGAAESSIPVDLGFDWRLRVAPCNKRNYYLCQFN